MTMKFYDVELEKDGVTRSVRVASPTDVQAVDAAMPLISTGEKIMAVRQIEDDRLQRADAPPPLTQAQELSDITPGAASRDDASRR